MYREEGGVTAFLSGAESRVMWLLPFTIIQLGVYEGKSGTLPDNIYFFFLLLLLPMLTPYHHITCLSSSSSSSSSSISC